MALGGGTFQAMNKTLPGAYFNFISAARAAAAVSDRGVVAMAAVLKWGKTGIIEITADTLTDPKTALGYAYTDAEMQVIREIMVRARKLIVYNMNTGVPASCTLATARYSGTKGNDLKIVVTANVDDANAFDVKTYLAGALVDEQIGVENMAALADNAFLTWIRTATLAVTAGTSLSGGTDTTETGNTHTVALAALEAQSFNVLLYTGTDATTKNLYKAFVRKLREDVGVKTQLVADLAGDYEGVINCPDTALLPWLAGAEAAATIGESLTNAVYDGELSPEITRTQAQLEAAILAGKLVFHYCGDELHILDDINSLVTVTADKGAEFKDNQTIRIIDGFATDVGALFNDTYLGKVPNDEVGRTSFKGQVASIIDQYVRQRAIEAYDLEDIVVTRGTDKYSVILDYAMNIAGVMKKLYGTVTIR